MAYLIRKYSFLYKKCSHGFSNVILPKWSQKTSSICLSKALLNWGCSWPRPPLQSFHEVTILAPWCNIYVVVHSYKPYKCSPRSPYKVQTNILCAVNNTPTYNITFLLPRYLLRYSECIVYTILPNSIHSIKSSYQQFNCYSISGQGIFLVPGLHLTSTSSQAKAQSNGCTIYLLYVQN